MKRVFRVRAVIDAIENVAGRAAVVQHRELRRIEEAAGTFEVESYEVSQPGGAVTDRSVLANRAERSIGCAETPSRLLLIEARFGDHVYDEAGLVAVLSGRRAGDDFQRLDCIGRQLRGKHLALLV